MLNPKHDSVDAVMCLYTFTRLLLPAESCQDGVVSRLGSSSAVKVRVSQPSLAGAAIPRLIRMPPSLPTSAPSSVSHSSATPVVSDFVKNSSLSVLTSSSITGSSVVSNRSSTLMFMQSSLKPNLLPNSVSSVSPSNNVTSSIRNSSTDTQSVVKHRDEPFRTQMILFQQSGQPHLLEIKSNCAWERSRPKVLARLSDLTKVSNGYPQPCTVSVDDFQMEVHPRPKFPTEIPPRLRDSIGLSEMFAIRVRITTGSVCQSASPSAAGKSSRLRLGDCNGLNVPSVIDLTVDSIRQETSVDITRRRSNIDISQQSTDIDITQPQPSSVLARHSTPGRAAADLSQQTNAAGDIDREKTNIDTASQTGTDGVSQHSVTGLLADSGKSSAADDTSMRKSASLKDCTDDIEETRLELLLATEAGCAAESMGANDRSCHSSDVNTCTVATGCVYSDNIGSCAAVQQHEVSGGAVTANGASGTKAASLCISADDGNFLPSADAVNLPSLSDQTLPVADHTKVTCSLPADDGKFASSSGLSVPIGCPLDLRT